MVWTMRASQRSSTSSASRSSASSRPRRSSHRANSRRNCSCSVRRKASASGGPSWAVPVDAMGSPRCDWIGWGAGALPTPAAWAAPPALRAACQLPSLASCARVAPLAASTFISAPCQPRQPSAAGGNSRMASAPICIGSLQAASARPRRMPSPVIWRAMRRLRSLSCSTVSTAWRETWLRKSTCASTWARRSGKDEGKTGMEVLGVSVSFNRRRKTRQVQEKCVRTGLAQALFI